MVLDQASNFEVIHGLLDLLMTKVCAKISDYKLVENLDDPRFLTGRGVTVLLNG
jgi:hypothetical protein